MSETSPSSNRDNQEKDSKKASFSIREFFTRARSRKEEKREMKEAAEIARWALMKFTSGEIKAPKRSIHPNKFKDSTKASDLMDSKATIIRMKGGFRYKHEKHFWFILVKMEEKAYIENINTNGKDMEVLDPIVEGYGLGEMTEISSEKQREEFPIEFAINFFYDLPQIKEVASTEQIDIMFAGSPETEKNEKVSAPVLELSADNRRT